MVINVSVQCNGGLLPDFILLTLCDSIGEPFQYHVEFLSLQPLFPPKPFDLLEGLDAFRFFFKQYNSGFLSNILPLLFTLFYY